ncbi:MAG: hypothetical protein WCO35_00755 [Candidatus Nomurabacteria bacterium]
MDEQSIYSLAIEILAHYTKLDYKLIEEAYSNPTFRVKKEPKKSGGFRTIHAPTRVTKEVVKNIYINFFKKIFHLNLISKHCCGGMKNKSVMDGILPHTLMAPKFIIDVDIRDAFHCITKEQIEDILLNIFLSEMNEHRRKYYYYHENILHEIQQKKLSQKLPFNRKEKRSKEEVIIEGFTEVQAFKKRMDTKEKWRNKKIYYWISGYRVRNLTGKRILLFPNKDYPYLRKLIRSPEHYDDVYAICKKMAEILSTIVTCEGIMPQGYNTSNILMALILSNGDILDLFEKEFLENKIPKSFVNAGYNGISVYVDSITISVYNTKDNKSTITKRLLKLIKQVELTSFWKFNMGKIHVYECEYENPMVTGLRLVKKRKNRQDLKHLRYLRIKGARQALRHFTPWFGLNPTIPKNTQRKIRSVFYLATKEEDKKAKIINQAKGYISFIKNIYKDEDIPLQVLKPMNLFIEHLEKISS